MTTNKETEMSTKPETQGEREELIRRLRFYEVNAINAQTAEDMRQAAALLADGKAGGESRPAFWMNSDLLAELLAGNPDIRIDAYPDEGMIKGGRPEGSLFYNTPLYTRPQPAAQVAQPLTDRKLEVFRAERDQARAQVDRAVALLTGIHSLLYPPKITTEDGRVMVFRPKSLDPHEVLQELSDRIRALPDEIDAHGIGKDQARVNPDSNL